MQFFFRNRTVKICAIAACIAAMLAAAFFFAPGANQQANPPVTGAAINTITTINAETSGFIAAERSESTVVAAFGLSTAATYAEKAASSSDASVTQTRVALTNGQMPTGELSAANNSVNNNIENKTMEATTSKYIYTLKTNTARESAEIVPTTTATTITTITTAAPPKTTVSNKTTTTAHKILTATLSIQCGTIGNNMDRLKAGKEAHVPPNGTIMAEKTVTFTQGETVFNILQRETRANGIQMEFSNNPMFNSVYIEGINNLYEFDCGELSGWMYKVNGVFPNYGCSQYQPKQGDVIEWVYTCDLGNDVGGGYAAGTQG
ncbi:MAG: DUF4430 domain-containing protein [Oscillospiraceae bacterium]|jgi:hypothetical protein|nr:DUF4430 domain-containing protein [Oscillospiraceae bacterium]